MKSPAICLVGLTFSLLVAGPVPNVSADSEHSQSALQSLHRWHEIANDATALDHDPVFRQQMGPTRASRALAIVHIAIFDALNAKKRQYQSYTGILPPKGACSMNAAIAQAAHDTLVALFPAQWARFDALLQEDLNAIRNDSLKINGTELGRRAAARILALRSNDGSQHAESFLGVDWTTSDLPGHWRMDPVSQIPIVLGAHWYKVAPFVVESSDQFRCPPPPPMTSPEYTAAYDEVKRLGSLASTERTAEQTMIGIYWGYDGTPGLSAPPRLFNQIALQIAGQMGSDAVETARLFALVNIAMADATLNVWETKYYYDLWRPITGIRESDAGTGPSGLGDGNPNTVGDPTWVPLGAPASNVPNGVDFTPPFPAYPSGHAGMGAALFETLRLFYGTDNIPFTFVSDEFNGVTRDSTGQVRPLIPRSFSTLSQAEEENGQSRVYLGVHWSFDKTASITLGRQVANYVFENSFQPLEQ
jgi:hypothetical protein